MEDRNSTGGGFHINIDTMFKSRVAGEVRLTITALCVITPPPPLQTGNHEVLSSTVAGRRTRVFLQPGTQGPFQMPLFP